MHVESWRETYSTYVPESHFDETAFQARLAMWSRFLELPEPYGTLTVAEDGERVVGFSFSGPAIGADAEKGFVPARDLHLFSIYLLAAEQGEGNGGRLLEAAVGNQPAQLWVASRNSRAIDFYRHHGFDTDGVEYFDPTISGLTELRMVR